MVIRYLNDDEAFKVAINLEKDGLRFYTGAARNIKDEKTRRVFLKLAEDEKLHLELFKKLDEELPSGPAGRPKDIDDEVVAYLNSLVDTGVFKGVQKRLEELKSLEDVDALQIGIQAEKDSILFYQEAYKNSITPSGKKAFKRLIGEEKKHLIILTERLRQL